MARGDEHADRGGDVSVPSETVGPENEIAVNEAIERDREALRRSREFDADGAAQGDGANGYENLHYGDREDPEFIRDDEG